MPKEYITTHARLREVAVAQLGEMAPGTTYQQFMTQARAHAAAKGVVNPLLVIAMNMKQGATSNLEITSPGTGEKLGEATLTVANEGAEMVYPIAGFEWNDFLRDVPVYCTRNPTVWVVDGDKFTAPI